MTNLVLVLPPRVAAAVRRARPGLWATLLQGPAGGYTWLVLPALVLAAQGTSRQAQGVLLATGLACVLLLHALSWARLRSAAARDPRVPVLLGLARTVERFNALAPQARIRATEAAAGLHPHSSAAEDAQATGRGLDGLAHALGRALAQQPDIGNQRTGWAGSVGGLDGHAQDLKRLARRVDTLERALSDVVVVATPPDSGSVLRFDPKRRRPLR